MTDIEKIKTQKLIADEIIIAQLTKQWQLIDEDLKNWTKIYIDIQAKSKWTLYRVDGYLQGGGYPILAKHPLPDTKQLIEIALFSDSEDEVFAACRTLTDNEAIRKEDFRNDLIEELEKNDYKHRQEKVVNLTNLDSPLNRRDIIGKTIDQVKLDATYFRSIAGRAKKLRKE